MDKKKIDNLQKTFAEAGQAVVDVADDLLSAAEPAVTAAVKEVTDKAAPMIKEVSDKAAPMIKEVSDKAAPMMKEVSKKAAPAVKRAKKAVTAIIPEMYIQVGDKELVCTDLTDRVKADYKKTHKDVICSCKIYIKPADNCAYYVINDTEGKIEL